MQRPVLAPVVSGLFRVLGLHCVLGTLGVLDSAGLPARAQAAEPRRVLIIHSFGEHFEPYATTSATFRTELSLRAPGPIAYFQLSLETARFGEGDVERPLAEYLRLLDEHEPLDLVVPVGAPALRFCARYRAELCADVPMVVCGVEERLYRDAAPAFLATGVTFAVDDLGTMQDILGLLPGTRRVAVIFGSTPLEVFWEGEMRRDWAGLEDRIEFVWLSGMPFADILGRAASLPPHSAVVFGLLHMDAAGVPYEQKVAIQNLREVSSAPVFGFFEPDLGHGLVGGRLVDTRRIGREAAVLASRVLAGESAGSIPPTHVPLTPPLFDARELERWRIPENRLPTGSELRFAAPSTWSAHRGKILALGGVAAVEAVLIGMLLTSRRRLRVAQVRLRDNELAVDDLRRTVNHADRVSLLGQVTASLAHELGQPLGAILRNAEAAEILFDRADPDLDEIRAILEDVHRDVTRAALVIERLRALLERRNVEARALPWSDVVADSLAIVQGDAQLRSVTVGAEPPGGLPPVRGDRIQLQQVLLNLMANAMDAIDESGDGLRRITVSSRSTGDGFVECAVTDTGAGIPAERMAGIFDAYTTTKPHGMGMGLPISRTIVEAHGGRLWAESRPGSGTTFRFTVPVASSREAA